MNGRPLARRPAAIPVISDDRFMSVRQFFILHVVL